MAAFEDGFWWSNDSLRLHYRDYPGPSDRPTILCLAGLTRNARDFEPLAERLAGGWRMICPDLRGRGDSAYAKDPLAYVPLVYLQDIERLIDELGLSRFLVIGTSLGGLLAMLLNATNPGRLAGVVLNDVGPQLEHAGLARIRTYVGKSQSWPTWLHAARGISETNRAAFPNYELMDWLAMAKRLCRLTPSGRVIFDYDMKVAEPFRLPGGEAGVDLWPAFLSLKDVPTLVLHGALSDLLSPAGLSQMAERLPGIETITIPDVGHAPLLTEPLAAEAIDRLLLRIV